MTTEKEQIEIAEQLGLRPLMRSNGGRLFLRAIDEHVRQTAKPDKYGNIVIFLGKQVFPNNVNGNYTDDLGYLCSLDDLNEPDDDPRPPVDIYEFIQRHEVWRRMMSKKHKEANQKGFHCYLCQKRNIPNSHEEYERTGIPFKDEFQ